MSNSSIHWFKYASPASFYPLAGRLIPWFTGLAVVFGVVGLYISFFVAPTDFRQGEAYRIMFIHVPAAWMSMFIYVVMAVYATAGFVWNTRLSSMMARSLAPTGALFTFIALWTGSFWGKPMWGTWWVWDARLTSELILLFLYIGYMSLYAAIEEPRRAARASGLFALVGVINVPIIYFSVQWWNTLHQGSSINFKNISTTMAASMFAAILVMTLCFWMYTIAVVLTRVRAEILEQERHTSWVEDLVREQR